MSARGAPRGRSRVGVRAPEVARLAAVLILFIAAPTVGDIGSCGESPQDLDAVKFFQAKDVIDCSRCADCGMATLACERACDLAPNQGSFERGCYPLIHDGEVCLNALDAASCDEYRGFMADEGATVPTECNFCPPKPDAGSGGGGGAGGAGGGSAEISEEP